MAVNRRGVNAATEDKTQGCFCLFVFPGQPCIVHRPGQGAVQPPGPGRGLRRCIEPGGATSVLTTLTLKTEVATLKTFHSDFAQCQL